MQEVAKELTELLETKHKCGAKSDTVQNAELKTDITHSDYKDKLILNRTNTCERTRIRCVAKSKHTVESD